MKNEELKILPYTATSLSVIGRFIFMFLLYKNKSTNSLSLIFCILSICSSSMWIYYSININDIPMIVRSTSELSLLSISTVYIIRNKLLMYQTSVLPQNRVLPQTHVLPQNSVLPQTHILPTYQTHT
jgi:uncharacterized protein with PQ loop repeat